MGINVEGDDIGQKSLAQLVDELVTTCIRCWMAQEIVMGGGESEKVAIAAKTAQETNARRNRLMRAIDQRVNDPNILPSKSYDPDAPKTISQMSREEELISHLTALSWNMLHPTDSVKNRQLAQAAHDYLIAIEKGEV